MIKRCVFFLSHSSTLDLKGGGKKAIIIFRFFSFLDLVAPLRILWRVLQSHFCISFLDFFLSFVFFFFVI